MGYLNEENLYIFLVQFCLLLGLARGLGEVFRRWKQPPLTAEILIGVLLGPTILGRFFPGAYQAVFPADPVQNNMLETIGWLGILFLLLETGLEIDFSSAWRQRGDALKIALADIIFPLFVSFTACLLLPDSYLPDPSKRLVFAAFMAIAMTISAMPVAARALHDLRVSKTDLGFLILSALSVNEIIGWLVFTVIMAFATQAQPNVAHIVVSFLFAVGFMFLCMTFGRSAVNTVITKIREKQLPEPGTSLTFICLLGLLCGAITQRMGIHALFGFFLAGVMAGGAKALSERTRQVISQMVYAIFVPIFFVGIGLKIDFIRQFDPILVSFVVLVGISVRLIGAWLGLKLTGVSRSNHMAVAVAHTPGGAMEIVIGMLALEYGIITEPVFVGIVCGGIFSAVLLGPWLAYSLKSRREISFLEYFFHRDIVPAMKAGTRDAAIRELCEVAGEHDDLPDADVIYSAVMDRENSMGTGLEEGIAVPHARLEHLRRPLIVFGRSMQGIEWNSPDGQLTGYVFLILTPQRGADVQVQILSLIVRAMVVQETRTALAKASDSEAIWAILQDRFSSRFVVRKKKT